MKKLIAAAVAVTFAMGSAFAQVPAPTPEVAAHAPAHKKTAHKKVAHKKASKKARKAAV